MKCATPFIRPSTGLSRNLFLQRYLNEFNDPKHEKKYSIAANAIMRRHQIVFFKPDSTNMK